MNKKHIKILILLTTLLSMSGPIYSESLFRSGISENTYGAQPRALFSSVKAKSVGDIVTININEEVNTSDDITFANNDTSSITDSFRDFWNKLLPGNIIPEGIGNLGGTSTVSKASSSSRKTTLQNIITAQVVQVLPNGNLLVQGKKTAINAKERVEVVISGIVDPRLITETGSINSNLVANLQVAVKGKGSISRSGYESPVTKYIRYLF